jgi:hypothetical protein
MRSNISVIALSLFAACGGEEPSSSSGSTLEPASQGSASAIGACDEGETPWDLIVFGHGFFDHDGETIDIVATNLAHARDFATEAPSPVPPYGGYLGRADVQDGAFLLIAEDFACGDVMDYPIVAAVANDESCGAGSVPSVAWLYGLAPWASLLEGSDTAIGEVALTPNGGGSDSIASVLCALLP